MNHLHLFPVLLLCGTLIACAPAAPAPTPTAAIPTVTTIAVENTPSPEPPPATPAPSATTAPSATVGATNTPAVQPPTLTPAPTDEPADPAALTPTSVVDPAIIPPAAIVIAQPASGSAVASPITIIGESNPTFEQNLIIRLISADGTELGLTPTTIQADLGQRGTYEASLEFEVSEPTPAFIQVFSDSPMDGGTVVLSSVGVQLLPDAQAGQADIIENADTLEHIVITSPEPGATITGGTLTIEGFGRATFENTLVVEVRDPDGNLLVNEAITVSAPLGGYGYFSVSLPYTVTSETSVRVSIRDVSPAHGGDAFVNSINVRLNP